MYLFQNIFGFLTERVQQFVTMDPSVLSSLNKKAKDFADYLTQTQSIYHRRLSAYVNIGQTPELLHIALNIASQKYQIRDSPVKLLNGSKVEASIICVKYDKNFGILGDVLVFPSGSREMQHNLQLEMSTNGPLARYAFTISKDLKNDLVNDVSAQVSVSAACGLAPSTKINQQFALGAHLWAPFPFVESMRSHTFLGFGASPNCPSYTAGVGVSVQVHERGRIDLDYCVKTGVRVGFGFDYAN